MRGTSKNCTLVQALRFCTGRTAHRESIGIALLFLDHGARRGWVVNVTPRPLSPPPGKTRYPFYRRLGGPEELVACVKCARNMHKRLVRRSHIEDTPGRAPRLRRENNIKVYITIAFD